MGTKTDPGQFDCLSKAEDDEPIFALLARDKHAPTLIWLWAALRELDGEDPEVVAEARQCAADMMAWAAAHDRRSVGLAQAVLAGVMELIRAVNATPPPNSMNDPTYVATLRHFLAVSQFEQEPAHRE